ncbi:MAG: sensor histidine kinase [Bacteroidota bacterium]
MKSYFHRLSGQMAPINGLLTAYGVFLPTSATSLAFGRYRDRYSFLQCIFEIMSSNTATRRDILSQVGFWILLFLVFWLDGLWYADTYFQSLVDAFTLVSWIAIGAYFNQLALLPWLFYPRKYFLYGISITLLITICPGIDYILTCWYYPGYEEEVSGLYYILSSMPYYLLIIALSTYYHNAQRKLQDKQVQTEILKEKLEAELNFLKAQVNPHFLFNTLNNIYAFAFMGHADTAPMIAKLADILRYMIYDCTAPLVPLEKEISNLQNLVDLYQMKNSKQQNLCLMLEGIRSNIMIAPLLLINLLENAFKHGDALSNADGFVHAKAEFSANNYLLFKIENSFHPAKDGQEQQAGVGLENLNRQLELLYPNRHQLRTETSGNTYTVELQLELTKR